MKSDHELLVTKFRLKLKKIGKITRPFRYDLNLIPYDNTANRRFNGEETVISLTTALPTVKNMIIRRRRGR